MQEGERVREMAEQRVWPVASRVHCAEELSVAVLSAQWPARAVRCMTNSYKLQPSYIFIQLVVKKTAFHSATL